MQKIPQRKFGPGDTVFHEVMGEGIVELYNPPWAGIKLKDGTKTELHEDFLKLVRKKGARKPKPVIYNIPNELWVMSYNASTMTGSYSHVSSGEKFYTSKEDCQKAIDEMPGWLGMGDRKRYRPLQIVKGS